MATIESIKSKPLSFVFILSLFGIFTFIEVWGLILAIQITVESFEHDLYYNDQRYRVERTFSGLMAPPHFPSLFIKNGLFERKYKMNYKERYGRTLEKNEIDSIKIKKFESNSIKVIFYHHSDTIFKRPNPLIFEIAL